MLELRNLCAAYGESIVLRDINLSVSEGQLVTVMGSNGVGKSTLLKTIMGTLKAHSGEVLWKEKPLQKLQSWERSQLGLAYVPQGRDIFPYLTVHENLILGLEARGEKKAHIKNRSEEMYETFPALTTIKKRKGGDLSGGQQQILALARVLLTKPELLILDEPSEGIQPSIVQQISDALGLIKKQGVSVLLVEQFPDFALSHADWYYLMEHGNLVQGGAVSDSTRAEIKASIHI